jgi:Domain of unknown function (DUF6249)
MILGFIAVAIVFWLVICTVIVANGYFIYQVRMARYRVMQTLADKDQPVPAELFTGSSKRGPVGLMRGGIVLVCIGVALAGFFWSMTDQWLFHGPIHNVDWLPTIGLFPLMIGVALLIMAWFERSRPQ